MIITRTIFLIHQELCKVRQILNTPMMDGVL